MKLSSVETIKILVVEDSPPFAKAISAMIDFAGDGRTHVTVRRTVAEAVQHVRHEQTDLILLDLHLPDSEGLDTLARMHKEAASVPIVIMTSWDDDGKALEALKLGAQDYLLKGDVNARNLQRTIAHVMERCQRQALETERLHLYEQREDFMATLTHDLKNPLIGANRILELLAQEKLGPQTLQQKKLLLKLHDSNTTLLAMIRNLVEVYRYEKDFQTLYKEHTDLLKLVSHYLNEALPIADFKQIEIKTELPPAVPAVMADQGSILRVMQNLIENAIKFTPNGGWILVKLWRDDSVNFQVKDSGPGICDEEQATLFQRFSQGRLGKAYSPGTGLGLYLCRQIVEAHDGTIQCHSGENEGATFTVKLPIAHGN